jgi:GLPGLI family protein
MNLPKWQVQLLNNSSMKKKILLFAALLVHAASLPAQYAHFTTSGTIEFEKRINTYALIQKIINKDNEAWMQPVFDYYKKNSPQFKVLNAKMVFSDHKTLYTPSETDLPQNGLMGDSPMLNQFNTIFTDLGTKSSTDQKKVFEQIYLVKDSTRKIKWKITDETREIAGYTCRRANGIYLDSVYVVAFYTTRIPLAGGPESFNGLPGMILGVALPHENITWFAKKVTEGYIPQNDIVPPKKGKATNEKDLWKTLQDAVESWGRYGKMYLKGFMM